MAPPEARQSFLTFAVGGEEYGIPILRVREIAPPARITRVPGTAPTLRGVINLRGTVVPLLDLRMKLGQGATLIDQRSCIVFVEGEGDDLGLIGLLVPRVERVLDILPAEIALAPAFGTGVRADYLHGIGRAGESLVYLLALDALLAAREKTR